MTRHHQKQYIVLAGGLTGGPIVPLLAIADAWSKQDPKITPIIFDLKNSFGESISATEQILFKRIITGKFRRYWSWKNITLPFLFLTGFFQSLFALIYYRPVIVLGAGGFVQVPVMFAAWILRIPRAIHQQDVAVTLSNSLCAPIANLVTTTFEFSIRHFPQGTGLGMQYIKGTKVFWTGNPTRFENVEANPKSKSFLNLQLNTELPVLLVFGGASGAQALNNIIIKALPELTKVVQVVHLTGPGKQQNLTVKNYHPIEFTDAMPELYNLASVVLARAGIGTLTELAEFRKPSIIVPMPQTHQESNAELIFRQQAALVLDQESLDSEILIKAIRKILFDPDLQRKYEVNMRKLFPANASDSILKLIHNVIHKHDRAVKKN